MYIFLSGDYGALYVRSEIIFPLYITFYIGYSADLMLTGLENRGFYVVNRDSAETGHFYSLFRKSIYLFIIYLFIQY